LKKSPKRRKLTPLGWATMGVILGAFVASIFLWIYPIVETEPITILTRVIVLFVALGAVSGAAVKLGKKRLFQE